jgi:multidrug efflux system membrane fusion protein
MNIENPSKTISHDRVVGADSNQGGISGWSSEHPRIARVLWIALILAVVAGVIWFFYPKPATNGGRFGGGGPQPVGVAKATLGPINITLNALGTVTPLATATVRPQVSGLLTKYYFAEGQMVKAGDPLAQIDPRPYQAALDQAKGQLAKDQAALAGAERDLKRYQALLAANAESQQVVDDELATVSTDQGVVESDKANVENAQINLGYTRIVSPVSGQVGLHQVDIGNIVSAGQTGGVVVVTELSPMSILFTVPEDSISQVTARVAAGATLTADAYDRSQTVKISSGKLATVDNEVDPTTGTVKLRAMFDNTDNKLFPSEFVNIRLLVDTLQDQVVIPVSAVQRGADGTFVFVVTPDKVANERDVKLGVQDGDKVAVLSGLQAGDTVVVDGADRLRDGADIEIPNPNSQITAPSGGAGAGSARAAQRAAQQAALAKTCAADIAKFCGGQSGRGAMRCLGQNRDSLSSDCSAAMAKLRGGRRGGGGGGGGGPGGGP